MEKTRTAEEFRTIGEVAEELDIPQHVLRFWEEQFAEVRPLKRRGGRRFYSQRNVETLLEIKTLLYDKGFTIKGAKKFLKMSHANSNQRDLFLDGPWTPPANEEVKAEKPEDESGLTSLLGELQEAKRILDMENV